MGLVLFAGAVYLVVSTVTRASVLALALELALLALFWLRSLRRPGARVAAGALAFAAMAAVAGGVLYLGTQGGYFQQRLATVSADADTRMNHWRTALGMMDQALPTQVFGMGLGRFPETYLWRNPQGAVPGNFRYARGEWQRLPPARRRGDPLPGPAGVGAAAYAISAGPRSPRRRGSGWS